MADMAASDTQALEVASLIETDSKILEQVRKDLSEEYKLFMSLVLKERLSPQSGGGASLFDQSAQSGISLSHIGRVLVAGIEEGIVSSGGQSLQARREAEIFPRSA